MQLLFLTSGIKSKNAMKKLHALAVSAVLGFALSSSAFATTHLCDWRQYNRPNGITDKLRKLSIWWRAA